MQNYLDISNKFINFTPWIERTCKPFDKGKLTAFPRLKLCQHNFKNVSNMLRFEELPEVNSERWLSLEDLEGEEWKPVVGHEKYYHISNYGRLKSLKRSQSHYLSKIMWRNEKIRKYTIDVGGYYRVALYDDISRRHIPVSHLVAEAFIPNSENKPQVDHINTNRKDNRVCNLRWVTAKENANNPITAKRVRAFHDSKIGMHYSEETRRKISETLKNGRSSGFWQKGELNYRSIPIIQLTLEDEYVKEWPCVNQAVVALGGHIYECCAGRRKTAAGYKWKFKKDYIK